MRIGHGYDVHAFTEGNYIVLGGVKIPHTHAFKAHSDGDVLIHAICDALLGACALGDIGQHFPDTASEYKNIDSRILLRHVFKLVQERGYKIGNLDGTIIAQAPKMAPHIVAMRNNLAADLQCTIEQINIKATTTERLGFEGRKEGISAHAVVLLLTI
ncbi:2-C-methyl-D-erythritol 2,4-cyclodiphosphate synthase [Thiofilum flexile]|uniref:2-C-methyl-D-erythritol 2,4-cyclodiphosphate synthase n=1 Tax=Thiofilum flexile TaxID=125627 RepID=UPI000378EC57|nr:2-C-methyl-D-erythritol 2,4-cyclodiphosphate synthase [Thiofilum flexile]